MKSHIVSRLQSPQAKSKPIDTSMCWLMDYLIQQHVPNKKQAKTKLLTQENGCTGLNQLLSQTQPICLLSRDIKIKNKKNVLVRSMHSLIFTGWISAVLMQTGRTNTEVFSGAWDSKNRWKKKELETCLVLMSTANHKNTFSLHASHWFLGLLHTSVSRCARKLSS